MESKHKIKISVGDADRQEYIDYEKEQKKQKIKNKVKQFLETIIKWLCVFLLILGISIIMYVIGIPDSISTPVLYIIGILIGFNLK